MVRSGAIVIIQKKIADLFPDLTLACCFAASFYHPQRFNHRSLVLEVTVLIPENATCAAHAASIDTTFIPNRQNNKTRLRIKVIRK